MTKKFKKLIPVIIEKLIQLIIFCGASYAFLWIMGRLFELAGVA